jgi:hypothetical protein
MTSSPSLSPPLPFYIAYLLRYDERLQTFSRDYVYPQHRAASSLSLPIAPLFLLCDTPIKRERKRKGKKEEVETLSTNTILRKVRYGGVAFRRKQFLVDEKRFYSAGELADHWVRVYPHG